MLRNHRQRALKNLSLKELTRLAHGALLNMHAQRDVDLTQELKRMTCPVLIVHGVDDTTVPSAFGQAIAAAIPGAKLVIVPATGHGLITHRTAQRLVSDWLRRSR